MHRLREKGRKKKGARRSPVFSQVFDAFHELLQRGFKTVDSLIAVDIAFS